MFTFVWVAEGRAGVAVEMPWGRENQPEGRSEGLTKDSGSTASRTGLLGELDWMELLERGRVVEENRDAAREDARSDPGEEPALLAFLSLEGGMGGRPAVVGGFGFKSSSMEDNTAGFLDLLDDDLEPPLPALLPRAGKASLPMLRC